jgi:Domain of unknown function (DUF4129)
MIVDGGFAADGDISREAARELARRELSRPEYHRDDPSLLQRLWEWIGERLRSFIDSFDVGGSGGGVSWVALGLIALLIAVAAAIILWWVGGIQRGGSRRDALLTGELTTARDHRAAAERHAAAGQWAEAIRERLRAIARDLEERVILEPRPGRTAYELAAEAAVALPGFAGELRSAARVFDDVWYGERPASEAEYRQLSDLDQRLRSARPAPIEPATAGSPA